MNDDIVQTKPILTTWTLCPAKTKTQLWTTHLEPPTTFPQVQLVYRSQFLLGMGPFFHWFKSRPLRIWMWVVLWTWAGLVFLDWKMAAPCRFASGIMDLWDHGQFQTRDVLGLEQHRLC
ncbi:hypothetical protein NFI96_001935 [Prochilodus magdalenae]|nr:hypothetical protein NFI96_001935 [Prochilodus magdalenae]